MKLYQCIEEGVFLSRPNRFIAHVETKRGEEICHVKNTGRCRELLLPGSRVILSDSGDPLRKTRCDLVAVYKGDRLINMDSQAPNRVAGEEMKKLFPGLTLLQPEARYGDSRLDFYLEQGERKTFVEVKGVTLEENNVCLFPDAPTERGVKHLKELEKCVENGFGAAILFVIQMEHVSFFTPNRKMHPAFADALQHAEKAGVRLMAYDCHVTENEMKLCRPVEIRL